MYLLFDIGGTKTRIAYSDDGKTCSEPVVIRTPKIFDEGIAAIRDTAKELAGGKNIQAGAGGIRGVLNKEKTSLARDTVLVDWVGKPLLQKLTEAFSIPIYFENDSAIVALGEANRGAGKGYNIVVYFTVSTGVGGARIVNGSLDEATVGFEPGKQVIDADQTLLPNSSSSTLEDLISGSAVKRRFHKEPYEIAQSDPLWDELAKWLAVGLGNTIVHWSPEVVVLGGSMMVGEPAIPIERVRKHLVTTLRAFPSPPELKLAELGDFGGLYGALVHVKQRMEEDVV